MKLLSIYIFTLQLILCYGYTRITNIKCESLNKDLCTINICKLKIMGRGKVGVDVHINNTGPPFREAKVNYSIWRKLSGYHPFLFNVTVDFCHLMGHPNPLNVFYYFHRAILPFSNINHTCPYDVSRILRGKRRREIEDLIAYVLYFSMILS